MTQPEWGFDVPPHEVDFERISKELSNIPLIYGKAYLSSFRKEAPNTWILFLDWCRNNKKFIGIIEELKVN